MWCLKLQNQEIYRVCSGYAHLAAWLFSTLHQATAHLPQSARKSMFPTDLLYLPVLIFFVTISLVDHKEHYYTIMHTSMLVHTCTVYPKKYAHGFCFAVLCCGYTLTDFPISIRLTSLALWQSNDCPGARKATLMNMDKYFMWIHYERLHNHNKAKHNKTVCIFLGIYCTLRHLYIHVHTHTQTQYIVKCTRLSHISYAHRIVCLWEILISRIEDLIKEFTQPI